jgi:hypothetical protein
MFKPPSYQLRFTSSSGMQVSFSPELQQEMAEVEALGTRVLDLLGKTRTGTALGMHIEVR